MISSPSSLATVNTRGLGNRTKSWSHLSTSRMQSRMLSRMRQPLQPTKGTTPKYFVPAKRVRAPKAVPKAVPKASPLPAPSPKAKESVKPLELAMVGAAPFQYLTKQKDVEIFAVLMRDLKYQLKKTEKTPTDPATKVTECYHEFLDVFSKEALNKVSPHSKYDHKIELLNGRKNHGQAALLGMSKPQLEFVQKFLEENLKKGFIEASRAPCSSPILLAKKPRGGIRFCVDY